MELKTQASTPRNLVPSLPHLTTKDLTVGSENLRKTFLYRFTLRRSLEGPLYKRNKNNPRTVSVKSWVM